MNGARFNDGREMRPLLMGSRVEMTARELDTIRDPAEIERAVHRRLFDLMTDRLIRDHAGQIQRDYVDSAFQRVQFSLELLIMTKAEWRQVSDEMWRLQEENRRLRDFRGPS